MGNRVLITGGSGLIGRYLTETLLDQGYEVVHLSRKNNPDTRIKTFLWDVDKGTLDPHCIDGVSTVIHLAGSGIVDERWTAKRKQNLIDSRAKSIRLIYNLLKNGNHQVRAVISASGIGYYSERGDDLMYEDSAPAHDFFGTCCIEWEKAVDEGKALGLRVLIFRTGVALTPQGGALPKFAAPIKLCLGAPLGSGKQWVSWIHLEDVIHMYLFGLKNESLQGVYNMVAPQPVTNRQLTKAIAIQLQKPLWLPPVPGFLLRLVFGEMVVAILGSTKVSSAKIEAAGFKFQYPVLSNALKEIYG